MSALYYFKIGSICCGISTLSCLAAQPAPLKKSANSKDTTAAVPLQKWQTPAVALDRSGTIDETRGNWYTKRELYRKARTLYDRIKKLTEKIESFKKSFTEERKKSDAQVTEFNKKLLFTKAELQEAITRYSTKIAALQQELLEADIQADEQGEQPPEALKLKKMQEVASLLEKLNRALDVVTKRDELLDKVLATLIETISKARSYEQKALSAYEAIAQTYSDEKATQLYSYMSNYEDNLAALDKYIQYQLLAFLRSTKRELTSALESAQQNIASLKKQRVPLSAQELKEAKEAVMAKRAAEEAEREKARAARKKQPEKPKSWWRRLLDRFF